MVINASSVAMPMLFGLAGTVIGISGVFWITGALVAGGMRLAVRLGEPRAGRKT
jgi:low temperature requirement protein LtrA